MKKEKDTKFDIRYSTFELGFTLLEVMVAISILAISTLVLTDTLNTSMILSGRAEKTTIASLLARQKMAEIEMAIKKDGFPSEEKEMKGDFAEDYENEFYKGFTWEVAISKIKINIPETFFEGIAGKQQGGIQIGPGIINDLISESIREIALTVYWPTGRKTEESLTVTYHVTQ